MHAASTRFVENPLRHWRPDRPGQAVLLGIPVSSCSPGDGATEPSFLVWGDSHVAVTGRLFDPWARERGQTGRLLAYNDCPPILGVDRAELPSNHRCAAHNERVVRLPEGSGPKTGSDGAAG